MSREPRDLALERLFEAELRGAPPRSEGLPAKAVRLVEGVADEREALDRTLEEVSPLWRPSRMPAVDRTILRMGLYELQHSPDVPVAVVIAEAVRLAKTYSTERSGAFVNGVLGELARRDPRSVPDD